MNGCSDVIKGLKKVFGLFVEVSTRAFWPEDEWNFNQMVVMVLLDA